jgi:hypothetical protein
MRAPQHAIPSTCRHRHVRASFAFLTRWLPHGSAMLAWGLRAPCVVSASNGGSFCHPSLGNGAIPADLQAAGMPNPPRAGMAVGSNRRLDLPAAVFA